MNEIDEPAEGRFLDLDRVHAELHETFMRRQETLIVLKISVASALLDCFEEGLRVHIGHEEEVLLPIHENRRDRDKRRRGGRLPPGVQKNCLGCLRTFVPV